MLNRSLPRTDMLSKSTETASYATDVQLDGMKFATVRINPRRSGMLSYEETVATAMDDVDRILDFGDGIAVVASNTWLAFQAVEMVKIEWETATDTLMEAITTSQAMNQTASRPTTVMWTRLSKALKSHPKPTAIAGTCHRWSRRRQPHFIQVMP